MKYSGITTNSKEVKPNYIYCCFSGNHFDGHDYINEAIQNGATKIIGSQNIENDIYEKTDDVLKEMVKYAQIINNNPQKKLNIIGVTGTDGKTSTALIIDYILNKISSSSYLGTNGLIIKNKEIEYSGYTTPSSDILYKNFKQAVDRNCEYFTMEVSSHALKLRRDLGVEYSAAVFTNLTNEHLDFHGTMENYFNDKSKLFEHCKDNAPIVINIDDEYGEKLFHNLERTKQNLIPITQNETNKKIYSNLVYIKNTKLEITGTTFEFEYKNQTYKVNSPLLAEFNIYNLLSGIIICSELGNDINEILNTIQEISIPGRLELIKQKDKPVIIIDFAHTPSAIKKVLNFINQYKKNAKIWSLTGSAGGGRDSAKRKYMGENAYNLSDYLILTEDDPREEPVDNIIADLKKLIQNKENVIEIPNRKKAIKYILKNANKDDIVVLLGKGNQKFMYYENEEVEYYEKEVVLELLKGQTYE